MNVNGLVNEILQRYATAASLDPDHNWSAAKFVDYLNRSRNDDPSGMTTLLLLRGAIEHLLEETQFKAAQVLRDRKHFDAEVLALRALVDLAESDLASEAVATWQRGLRATLNGFGVKDWDAIDALMGQDSWQLGQLQADALHSLHTLRKDQFSHGSTGGDTLKVNTEVFKFFNVNSLLAALAGQKITGVTMALIFDARFPFTSHFAFGVRNGETITLLSDHERGPHPRHREMTRRPDKRFSERAQQHWFPYDLLELQEIKDEHGDVVGLAPPTSKALVRYDTVAFKIADLGALPPRELIWAVLVMEQIRAVYGEDNPRLPALSYTGEMIVAPEILAIQMGLSTLAPATNPRLSLEKVTRETLGLEALGAGWEEVGLGHHRWMLEAYGEASEALLNPLGEEAAAALNTWAEESGLLEPERYPGRGNGGREVLKTLNPTDYGTLDELRADQVWVARYNQCLVVEARAKADFNATCVEVCAWWRERVLARREEILKRAAAMSWCLPTQVRAPDFHAPSKKEWANPKPKEALHFSTKGPIVFQPEGLVMLGERVHSTPSHRGCWRAMCAIHEDRTASWAAIITPTTPAALAECLGIGVNDLPLPLRHWYPRDHEPYQGNNIIERLDPLDFITNPWSQLEFKIAVNLSKTGWVTLRKRAGLPTSPKPV